MGFFESIAGPEGKLATTNAKKNISCRLISRNPVRFFVVLSYFSSSSINSLSTGESGGPRELGTNMTMLNSIGPDGKSIRTLNHTQLLRAKLKAWDAREDQKFDREDIKWLLEHHGDKIDASQLKKDIAAEFVETYEDKIERERASKILGLS